jgi:hypothetical protein
MPTTQLNETDLHAFAKDFDSAREDAAVSARGDFLQACPVSSLKDLTLDEYVIGKGTASFCAWVEAKTKAWANIQGATANKFGIYYGRTKSDPARKYRFTKKFGVTETEAFDAVLKALLSLIEAGKAAKFQEIDDNPLSQMFKAKILSLYYPEVYLNICSSEHLELIASGLGLPDNRCSSEYQSLLVNEKLRSAVARSWSNPRFMFFLYAKVIKRDLEPLVEVGIKRPATKSKHKINFEDSQADRDAIGKMSEDFAIAWERNRLVGLGLEVLVPNILDRRDMPSYGYDFQSFNTPKQKRYIEVKSLGYDHSEKCSRFFLSQNEREVSTSHEHKQWYYFYLVRYGKDGKPRDLIAKHAADVYSHSELVPCTYVVRLEVEGQKA